MTWLLLEMLPEAEKKGGKDLTFLFFFKDLTFLFLLPTALLTWAFHWPAPDTSQQGVMGNVVHRCQPPGIER